MTSQAAERYPLTMECPACGRTMRPVHKHRVPDMPRTYFCTFCEAEIPYDHPLIRFREPTVLVPVVFCKDCMWWKGRGNGCPKLHGLETPDDFFCKEGYPK